jgi:hypothetical protein
VYVRWPDSSSKSSLGSVGVAVDTKEAEACAVVEIDIPFVGTRRVSLCTKTS